MLLELRDVHYRYPDRNRSLALGGVSLELRAGEILTVIGPNGAGKSSLLGVACGALRPQRGEVLFQSRPVSSMSRREIAGNMALVSQAPDVRFPLTALEYVLTGRFSRVPAFGFDSDEDVEIALAEMERTDAAQFAARPFNGLSSGERQRVVLARALAQQPGLLLLDEPTANADMSHQISLLATVRKLARERDIGAIVVTHEINLASEFGDRVALMKDCAIASCAPPDEALTAEALTSLFGTPLAVDRHPHSGKPRVSWNTSNLNPWTA